MGRPSKFTPDRCERFLGALRTGVFPETAARHAGWSSATLYRILRASTPAHVAFREDVLRVETELELRLAGTVTQAAFTDPRLALSLLERRFGERWGRRAGLLAAGPAPSDGRNGAGDLLVIEPALVEALVPVLLTRRVGAAASPEALQRVAQFELASGPEVDDE
jgi:hypothetical protein